MSFRKPYTDSNNNNYIYLGEFYLYQNPLNLLCFQCCCFCLRPQKPSFKYGKNGVSNFRDITDINFLSWVVVAALPKVCQIDHAHWTWTWNLDIGPEHFLLGYKPWHWTLTLSSGFAQGIWTHMLSLKFYLKHQVEEYMLIYPIKDKSIIFNLVCNSAFQPVYLIDISFCPDSILHSWCTLYLECR